MAHNPVDNSAGTDQNDEITTTIQIPVPTRERVKSMKRGGETYGDTIVRICDFWDKHHPGDTATGG